MCVCVYQFQHEVNVMQGSKCCVSSPNSKCVLMCGAVPMKMCRAVGVIWNNPNSM